MTRYERSKIYYDIDKLKRHLENFGLSHVQVGSYLFVYLYLELEDL